MLNRYRETLAMTLYLDMISLHKQAIQTKFQDDNLIFSLQKIFHLNLKIGMLFN